MSADPAGRMNPESGGVPATQLPACPSRQSRRSIPRQTRAAGSDGQPSGCGFLDHAFQRQADRCRRASAKRNIARNERARALWHRLNQYVGERGGGITTAPYHWPAMLEVFPESELPAKLKELGWALIDRGSITRIGTPPDRGGGYAFRSKNVYDVLLPR